MSLARSIFDLDAAIEKLQLRPAKVANFANLKAGQFCDTGRYTDLIDSPANVESDDIELRFDIEEKAAIMEIDGGVQKIEAERMAFEQVIGMLDNNEIRSVLGMSLSQIKLLTDAKSVFNGNIL